MNAGGAYRQEQQLDRGPEVSLNPAQGVFAVRQGKGRKDRFVPIGERVLAWVEKYLADGRPEAPGEDTLFLDQTGRRLVCQRRSKMGPPRRCKEGPPAAASLSP